MSANFDSHSQKSAYSVRVKHDSQDRVYLQIQVPSARGLAWVPVPHMHAIALRQHPPLRRPAPTIVNLSVSRKTCPRISDVALAFFLVRAK